ncbi:hypothetical protein ACF0H5_000313 [Mactra antiquata]
MFLRSTTEVQVKPYEWGKLYTTGNGSSNGDIVDDRPSSSSKQKLSVDQYHFLENKDNFRPVKKRDKMPKIERELSDAYIDTITRTPRYGLGRHKTYDEILLSMSTDDPFGKLLNPLSSTENLSQNSTSDKKNNSDKTPVNSVEKEKKKTDKSLTDDTLKVDRTYQVNKGNKSARKETKEKVDGNVENSSGKPEKEKTLSRNKEDSSSNKVSKKSSTLGKQDRSKSDLSSTDNQVQDKRRKVSKSNKMPLAKKSVPRKSKIPVLQKKLFDKNKCMTRNEYEYQPLEKKMIGNSKIPIMKDCNLSDIEKRKILETTNTKWRTKQRKNKPTPIVSSESPTRKGPSFSSNTPLASSPRQSVDSHVYGSSLGSPWRRAGSAQGTRSSQSMYPVQHVGTPVSEIEFISSPRKYNTLDEADLSRFREMSLLRYGVRSKTMIDDNRTIGYQEPIMTPNREHHQPRLDRELSDAYIESISRTPRYGLGRHKTYDEILTSMSLADPFNGNYEPSGINPREKTNISLRKSPDVNQSTSKTSKNKTKG